MMLAFSSIGGGELLLIFLVVLLIFGARRIPEIARSLGRAMHEFKNAKDDIVSSVNDSPRPPEKKKDDSDQDSGSAKPQQ